MHLQVFAKHNNDTATQQRPPNSSLRARAFSVSHALRTRARQAEVGVDTRCRSVSTMTRPPIGTRGVSGGGKAGRGAGSGEGSRRAGASNTSSKKYTGVTLKSNGRWRAQCRIGGKQTSLGYFGNEEEAARAWDRTRLWSCKAGRRAKKEVEKLNFPLSEYSDDEVTALQGCTQEEIIKKLQRTEERAANQASKYTGVYLYKRNGRWEAQCKIGGKLTSLGARGTACGCGRAKFPERRRRR
jgi:hypothetical protein